MVFGSNENDFEWVSDLNDSCLNSLANNYGFYQRMKQKTADRRFSQYFTMLSRPLLANINVQYQIIMGTFKDAISLSNIAKSSGRTVASK